jgi:ABC-type sugar transport system substrate-binding protein
MISRRHFVTASAALAVGLASLSLGGPAFADKRTINIAWTVDVLDQTQNAIYTAMKAHVDAINKSRDDINVTLTAYDAQGNVAKQISDVEAIVLKHPDALIFNAVDSKGSLPAAKEAHDAGIKIIDIRDMKAPDVVDVVFYGSNEPSYAAGTLGWIKSYLAAHPNDVLNVGLIYGSPAQVPQLLREDAVKDLAKQMPDRIKIVAEGYGNWDNQTAMNMTEDWLKAHPEVNYISCANDIMALGASNAVMEAGKKDKVMVSGYDVTDEGVARIKSGGMDLSVGGLVKDYGNVIDVAVGTVLGTFKDKTYTVTKVYSVTPQNIDQFLAEKNGT